MADYGHKLTEYELSKLEKKIAGVYSEAREDLDKTITAYFQTFQRLDEEKKQKVVDGLMTQQEYTNWRLNAIGRGQRYEAMRDKVATRMTDANAVARAYVEDATPGIYALNRNFAAYTIEKAGAQVDFTLFDEQTVRRLIVEDPDSMPYYSPAKALDRGIDLAYGKKQINKAVTSGILQGKSIPKMAKDLQDKLYKDDKAGAIRAARTAVTSAENAGRVDTYKAAEDMGIELEQEWLATLDSRTRHSHRQLDGERIKVGETFSNGCRFPGDPLGEPEEVYNCRCTLVAALKKVDQSFAPLNSRISGMTYEEWKKGKNGGKNH